MSDVSLQRLYVMRALYICIVFVPGLMAARSLFAAEEPLGILQAVTFSFWTALGILAIIAVRYPLQMLPLLLIQMLYKLLWLCALPAPLLLDGEALSSGMMRYTWIMGVGVLVDLFVIPWPYVAENYIRKRGDRWA